MIWKISGRDKPIASNDQFGSSCWNKDSQSGYFTLHRYRSEVGRYCGLAAKNTNYDRSRDKYLCCYYM